MTTTVKLGMQGWNHQEWVGRLYPTDVSSSAWLAQYSARFPTVEVDDTFYGLPPEPLVRRWRGSVGSEFVFAPRVPQQITHEQRFSKSGGLLKRFLDRVSLLEETLGPLLLIAPPEFRPDDESKVALRKFIEHLPSDHYWALELRHREWYTDETHDLLASRNVALVLCKSRWIRSPSLLKVAEVPTAGFSYIRWNNTSDGRSQAEDRAETEEVTAALIEPAVRLCGQVGSVYGYFHSRAFGDGLRSAKELQYTIDQSRLEASVSIDGEAR